jgi:hypothetical protein
VKLNTIVHSSGIETKIPVRVSEVLGIIIIIIIIVVVVIKTLFLIFTLIFNFVVTITSLTLTANI